MSKLITDEVAAQLKEQFTQLNNPVKLIFFTQPNACGACSEQGELLSSLTELDDKLSLTIYSLESPQAIEYKIDKVPATIVMNEEDYGIRFFGLTGGHEFSSLLESILRVSLGKDSLDPALVQLASTITVPTHLQVLVTLACPYCSKMVSLVHQLAMANENIRADMIDSAEFPQLVNRYDVQGVPLTIINGQRGFEGALPMQQAIFDILKIVDPTAYEAVEAKLREAQGLRKISEADTNEIYDIIVIGAGPAGLTAALYAQRKGRKTALIGKLAGGQINDTEAVENYPGLVKVGGSDLAQAMRHHLETYPVAEHCHAEVTSIDKENDIFKISTEDNKNYQARSVIYCTGKRYRRLNVPGEDRFIGHGIAWCATCDAPLFKDKRVAVIGGGNSAFTAVRDLLRYASEIYLIHILDEFQADSVLIDEIKKAETDGRVKIHLNSQIREYFGNKRLEGVRLAGKNGEAKSDLAIEGVFLEVGLEPNSSTLASLISLDKQGQVPVNKDQSTSLSGLFGAGDVTDEQDKQIVIAAAAGAKAALSADRYLAAMT